MYFATNLANRRLRRINTLDPAADAVEITRDVYEDPGLKLLKKLGLRHEQAYLNELQSQRRTVLSIATEDTPWSE